MAMSNFLTLKTHLSELKSHSDRDSVSEVSDSGTSNSVTSAEDLQKFAVILGLSSAEEVYQERFRIDRRRLESMLTENLEDSQTAQAFFNKVMNETNTLVNWPARLKIGARSKKDPHVRVAGRPDDVRRAREKIMQLLDSRGSRVTMKIDVSYTDHSHIIGRGGQTIKRVMEETGCHIHFPDSNRTNSEEKSNQVSIAGDLERAERARAKIRALTPLVFSFELPVSSPSHPLPNIDSPYVRSIQEKYNVQVSLRNRAKLHVHLLIVKGVQWEVEGTMEATTLLMNYMCGHLANQTLVQTSLEISPVHHSVVIGNGAEQLKVIMKGTNTQIMFPDAGDPNVPIIRKSTVFITGQIKDVYAARQQLIGSLPLVLIFDVAEDLCKAGSDTVDQLTAKHNVYMSVRRKPKQGVVAVVIKGIERYASDVYEARRELLGGNEPKVNAQIPESYSIPSISPHAFNFAAFNPYSPSPSHQGIMGNSPYSPFNLQFPDVTNSAYNSPLFPQHPPTPGGYPSPLSPLTLTPQVYNAWMIPSPQPGSNQFLFPNMAAGNNMYKGQQTWPAMGGNEQPMTMPQQYTQNVPNQNRNTACALNSSSQASSSGYQSNFTGSSVSLDVQNLSNGDGDSHMASPSVSPISSKAHTQSPTPSNDTDRSQNAELATIISDIPISERRAVGCEKKTLETLNMMSPRSNYRSLQAEAHKAMHEPIGSGSRVPNSRWMGHFFSNTSPAPLNFNSSPSTSANVTPDNRCKKADLVRPNVTVQSPVTPPSKPCSYQQLFEVLRNTGLQKYIELFKQHEVDISTFARLDDKDLIEIGVTAFGARKKMQLIIAELKKQASVSGGAPSPLENKLFKSPQYNTSAISQNKW